MPRQPRPGRLGDDLPGHAPRRLAQSVDPVAARTAEATPVTARWDVSSVLGALPPLIGDDLGPASWAGSPSATPSCSAERT